MKRVTRVVERADLIADVAILTEMVAYLFARNYGVASSEIELERLPERLTGRLDERLAPLKDMDPEAHADAIARYRERLRLMLSALNTYRTSGAAS